MIEKLKWVKLSTEDENIFLEYNEEAMSEDKAKNLTNITYFVLNHLFNLLTRNMNSTVEARIYLKKTIDNIFDFYAKKDEE